MGLGTTTNAISDVGDDVDVCIHRLFTAAGQDPALASVGIVVIDEVDKLARRSASDVTKDVSGEGVQQGSFAFVPTLILVVFR